MSMPSPATMFQMPISAQNDLPLPQFPHGATPPCSRFGRDLAHMGSMDLSTQNFPENHVLNSGPMGVNGPRFMIGLMQHQMQRPNGLMLPLREQHGMLPIQ
jgi:DNA topoisomerase 2-associated protein PAT1